MHRAQTKISLFSTAIANLCEELECREHRKRRSAPHEQHLTNSLCCSILVFRMHKEATHSS
jgi:hypothetical protein